jgi:ferredoxin
MNTKIYYFTGTGNSLHVARTLAQAEPGSELVGMAAALNDAAPVRGAETVGFVHPLYWYGLPGLVRRFLQRLDLATAGYVFSVITCEHPRGLAHRQTSALLRTKGKRLDVAFYVPMPNNYILGAYHTTPAARRQELFGQTEEQVRRVSEVVASRQRYREVNALTDAWFALRKRPGRKHEAWRATASIRDAPFVAEVSCDGCEICAQVCPVANVVIVAGRPRWQGRCEQCLACIHHCPRQAIQFGLETASKPRYRHPDIELADIIGQKGRPPEHAQGGMP